MAIEGDEPVAVGATRFFGVTDRDIVDCAQTVVAWPATVPTDDLHVGYRTFMNRRGLLKLLGLGVVATQLPEPELRVVERPLLTYVPAMSGFITAAHGWCAPSSTIYDSHLSEMTESGLQDLSQLGIHWVVAPAVTATVANDVLVDPCSVPYRQSI